jgi:hypothetical protein
MRPRRIMMKNLDNQNIGMFSFFMVLFIILSFTSGFMAIAQEKSQRENALSVGEPDAEAIYQKYYLNQETLSWDYLKQYNVLQKFRLLEKTGDTTKLAIIKARIAMLEFYTQDYMRSWLQFEEVDLDALPPDITDTERKEICLFTALAYLSSKTGNSKSDLGVLCRLVQFSGKDDMYVKIGNNLANRIKREPYNKNDLIKYLVNIAENEQNENRLRNAFFIYITLNNYYINSKNKDALLISNPDLNSIGQKTLLVLEKIFDKSKNEYNFLVGARNDLIAKLDGYTEHKNALQIKKQLDSKKQKEIDELANKLQEAESNYRKRNFNNSITIYEKIEDKLLLEPSAIGLPHAFMLADAYNEIGKNKTDFSRMAVWTKKAIGRFSIDKEIKGENKKLLAKLYYLQGRACMNLFLDNNTAPLPGEFWEAVESYRKALATDSKDAFASSYYIAAMGVIAKEQKIPKSYNLDIKEISDEEILDACHNYLEATSSNPKGFEKFIKVIDQIKKKIEGNKVDRK